MHECDKFRVTSLAVHRGHLHMVPIIGARGPGRVGRSTNTRRSVAGRPRCGRARRYYSLEMPNDVLGTFALGMPWQTQDPFLFCVHHDDAYPAGDDQLGPAASLAGRDIGQDFAGIDGWRMYHGDVVPGFPEHPHRGFETVTLVRHGLLDHSD